MAATPKLPVYKAAIEQVLENVKTKFYGDRMLSITGPAMFGSVLSRFPHQPRRYVMRDCWYRLCDIDSGDTLVLKNNDFASFASSSYGTHWHNRTVYT